MWTIMLSLEIYDKILRKKTHKSYEKLDLTVNDDKQNDK